MQGVKVCLMHLCHDKICLCEGSGHSLHANEEAHRTKHWVNRLMQQGTMTMSECRELRCV